jgi:hypothetical protein
MSEPVRSEKPQYENRDESVESHLEIFTLPRSCDMETFD